MLESLMSLTWGEIASIVAVCSFCYVLAVSVYRLHFHPLSKFPGPRLAAWTKWYELYFDLLKQPGGQFMWEIQRMHKVYGPIVRINPDELHIDDPDFFEVLYASSPTKRDKYAPAAHMAGTPLGTFGTVSHELHRKRRGASSFFFSSKAIASAETLLQEQAQTLSSAFVKAFETREILELRTRFLAFSTDTVSRYALGKSFGLQHDLEGAQKWNSTIRAIATITPVIKQFPWLLDMVIQMPLVILHRMAPDLARVVQLHYDMLYEAGVFLSAQGQESPEKEVETLASHKTLFQCITQSHVAETEKAQERIAQEAVVVVSAGSETTSRVLSVAMFHLIENPDILQHLQDEVDKVMPDVNRPPSTKETSALPYLNAVVKETLRLSALITSRTPLCAPNELMYKDWVIPAKTPTSLSIHDVLLNEQIYESPNKFFPERWLGNDVPPEKYFVPFGNGTRTCQGMRFALVELNLVLTTLIRRFNFRLYDTTRERDVDLVRDCFVGESHPESVGIRVEVSGLRQ